MIIKILMKSGAMQRDTRRFPEYVLVASLVDESNNFAANFWDNINSEVTILECDASVTEERPPRIDSRSHDTKITALAVRCSERLCILCRG